MIKVFYIEDNNGKFVSADGHKRWTRLTGKALYDFLQTERGKNTYFFDDTDEKGVCIGVEISDAETRTNLIKEDKHNTYLRQMRDKSGLETVSFDFIETPDGESCGDEIIVGDDNLEESVFHSIDLKKLRAALQTLSAEEYNLIFALYLQNNPMTERAYSAQYSIPQKTINDRKNRILKKLKSFF